MDHVLFLSYGKDSIACLGAIEQLGLPLDRIVHAEVWATDTIPADLPPMVSFKSRADSIIKERYGIEVEHYACSKLYGIQKDVVTYNDVFYRKKEHGKYIKLGIREIYGFPIQKGSWCQKLKVSIPVGDCVEYVGIAEDESERLERLDGKTKISPLHLIGWTEDDAKRWCIENDLLSPIYTDTCLRGGCWFCHNQGVQQLRELRHNYPDLWALMLKWDDDSPVTFKADGHKVRDFDKRFSLEDSGMISKEDKVFRWSYLNNPPPRQLDIFGGSEVL